MVLDGIWEPNCPRAQLSSSFLSSHPHNFLTSPVILSLIQTHSPFPFISCCLPLRASQFLIYPPISPPCPLPPRVQPYFSFLSVCPHSSPMFLPLLFSLVTCQIGEKAVSRGEITAERASRLTLFSWPLILVLGSFVSGDISNSNLPKGNLAVCHVEKGLNNISHRSLPVFVSISLFSAADTCRFLMRSYFPLKVLDCLSREDEGHKERGEGTAARGNWWLSGKGFCMIVVNKNGRFWG